MTVHAVAQKPLRRCLLLSGQPRRRGDCGLAEVCSQTEMCGEPKAIPLVDASIRERDAIKEAECCSLEDILVLGCREGLVGGDVIHHEGIPLGDEPGCCSFWRSPSCARSALKTRRWRGC